MNKFLYASLAMFLSTLSMQAQAEQINVAEVYDNMQEQIRGTSEERMAMMDTNKDGIVTKKEYEESEVGINNMRNKFMFDDIDTDKDGKINVEDYYTALSIRNYQLLVRIAEAAKNEEKAKTEGTDKAQETAKTEQVEPEKNVNTETENTNAK